MAHRTTCYDFGLAFANECGDLHRREDLVGQPLQVNNIGGRQFTPLTASNCSRVSEARAPPGLSITASGWWPSKCGALRVSIAATARCQS